MKKNNILPTEKQVVDFIANVSPEALILKDLISQNNFVVNHIYSGSSIPILKDADYYVVGSNHIRACYTTQLNSVKSTTITEV